MPSWWPTCRLSTGDPFDRLLLAQALVEGMIFLTADPVFEKYPGPIQML
jgi:PIN domain nuclease of toxin-antitoxin system